MSRGIGQFFEKKPIFSFFKKAYINSLIPKKFARFASQVVLKTAALCNIAKPT